MPESFVLSAVRAELSHPYKTKQIPQATLSTDYEKKKVSKEKQK